MNPTDETRRKEERKQPEIQETVEAPAVEKLDDQDLTGAAGGMDQYPTWIRLH